MTTDEGQRGVVTSSVRETGGVWSEEPLIGRLLDGRYRIIEHLSSGGVGTVYRAEQETLMARQVAVKVLRPTLAGALGRIQRFEHEARITSRLRHPNTLRVLDAGRLESGQLYLVTELLDGLPLDRVLRSGPLDQRRVVGLARQICGALREAHGFGIIHRDLKPGNVFLESIGGQEVVKVLDFGMAKLVNFPGVTAPMTMCGTPGYMAPEQILGLRVDERTDIYALGVLLYEALAGLPPFSAPAGPALLVKHLREAPEPIWVRADVLVDPRLERLVLSMLAKSPDERPHDMAEVEGALADIEYDERSEERRVRNLAPGGAPQMRLDLTRDRRSARALPAVEATRAAVPSTNSSAGAPGPASKPISGSGSSLGRPMLEQVRRLVAEDSVRFDGPAADDLDDRTTPCGPPSMADLPIAGPWELVPFSPRALMWSCVVAAALVVSCSMLAHLFL